MQNLGCHFGNEIQILLWWFKLPTQMLFGERDVLSPFWEVLNKSLILSESLCPHLLKGGKCSCSSYKNGACRELMSKSDSCPPFLPHICLSYFLQTHFTHGKKKRYTISYNRWHTWRLARWEMLWRIRILPTQTAHFNVKIKHNVKERPLVSSCHSTIPYKGIKVDYLVFSQFQIFLSYAFPMESLFAHWEKPRWFSPYFFPSQTGPFSLSNLQNYNSNGRKIDSKNSLDVIAMIFKTHF